MLKAEREGQTDSAPVDIYYSKWTTKGVRCNPKVQFSRVFIEGPCI